MVGTYDTIPIDFAFQGLIPIGSENTPPPPTPPPNPYTKNPGLRPLDLNFFLAALRAACIFIVPFRKLVFFIHGLHLGSYRNKEPMDDPTCQFRVKYCRRRRPRRKNGAESMSSDRFVNEFWSYSFTTPCFSSFPWTILLFRAYSYRITQNFPYSHRILKHPPTPHPTPIFPTRSNLGTRNL